MYETKTIDETLRLLETDRDRGLPRGEAFFVMCSGM